MEAEGFVFEVVGDFNLAIQVAGEGRLDEPLDLWSNLLPEEKHAELESGDPFREVSIHDVHVTLKFFMRHLLTDSDKGRLNLPLTLLLIPYPLEFRLIYGTPVISSSNDPSPFIARATIVRGVPVMRLRDIYEWKRRMGRPKDKLVMEMIQKAMEERGEN